MLKLWASITSSPPLPRAAARDGLLLGCATNRPLYRPVRPLQHADLARLDLRGNGSVERGALMWGCVILGVDMLSCSTHMPARPPLVVHSPPQLRS